LTKISNSQENDISIKKDIINKILIEKYEDSILLDVVSDSGIKAFILQQIIPAINDEVSRNLPKFDVNGNIAFNTEFKPTFYRNGVTVDFDSFSDGTKAKMDICTLISIIKTIKSKYNDINVIFLDEVLSSIDIESRDHIIGTIKQICCDELKMHTFICNHSEIPSHHFDYKLCVTNDGNFSDINIETL
jgi:DNA repair exonuclease SbcCD ATPase subunit